ncbi:WGR domain-containing protein [Xanthomonas phage XaC1]|nr:WGR domain-containing protein [Xanthomonas phage XaC1]
MKLNPKEVLFEVTEPTATENLTVAVHALNDNDGECDEDICPNENFTGLNHKGSNLIFSDEGYGAWSVETRDGTEPTRHQVIEYLQDYGFTYCTADDLSTYKAGTIGKVPLESTYLVLSKMSDVLIELVPVINTRCIRKPTLMYVASAKFSHDTTVGAVIEDVHYNSGEKIFGSDCHSVYNIFGDTDDVKGMIQDLAQEILRDSTSVHNLHSDIGDYIVLSMWEKDGKAFGTISMDCEYVSDAYNAVLDSNDKVQAVHGGAACDDLDLTYAIMQYLKVDEYDEEEDDDDEDEDLIEFFKNNDIVDYNTCFELMKFVVRNVLTIQMDDDMKLGLKVKLAMDKHEVKMSGSSYSPVRLTYNAGASSKEYNLEIQGTTLITKYGKIGKALKVEEKDLGTEEKVLKEYTKKLNSKVKSGYQIS